MRLFVGGLALILASAARAATFNVVIQDMEFTPDPTIHLGDTVHWIWNDGFVPHSTTAASGQAESWDSGIQGQGFTFDHIFTHVGQFNYYWLYLCEW